MHVVLAGGGSAGHVEPMMNTADALRRADPAVGISALGTAEGLESRLVPLRGYPLAIVPKVPLPRRPGADLVRVPGRLWKAVKAARAHLDAVDASVVVGFGGYVSVPAYVAARRRGTPIVVHEQNARAGIANRLGARWARTVAAAVDGSGLKGAHVIGIPLRRAISFLDRAAERPAARASFGLGAGPVLLVFGGSLGARRINTAVAQAAGALAAAGVQVLHVTGTARADEVRDELGADKPATHHLIDYVDGMDAAYAAADLALCRAGANTCAELAAVGLPAVYVPLPIGNGEQALNARPVVDAGGGLLVDDAALDAEWIRRHLVPLLQDPARLVAMGAKAAALGHRDADDALARLVLAAAR
ncbi:MAG: undecaprenyldiphospho-muramoylpentapeptide beta-N-acetylglucosaminyltransferase [Frankiaceae bacterium]|nr:undecaprenyldiphospho-muramoylpentapeptide beta-N-acetylglucosaminyltransferase [Frankiaceae bacterium]